MSSLIAKNTSTSTFEPIEAGTYPAICSAIIDIGMQYNKAFDKESHKVIIIFELPDETYEADGIIRSRTISGEYTLSLSDRSNLRKMLEAWRGKAFTPEELEGFDLEKVLGLPCLVTVINETNLNTGKTYSNIGSVSKVIKGMNVVGREEPFLFDLMADNMTAILPTLPEWIKNKIFESSTYKEVTGDRAAEIIKELAETAPVSGPDDLPF